MRRLIKTTAYANRVKKMDDAQRQPYAPRQACRACGNSRGELLFIVSGCPVVRCSQCRLVFLDIVHDAPSIEEMYRQYGCTDETVYFEGINAGVERNIDRFLARCRQYLAAPGPKQRLLDIGCGNGALLKRALQAGFECQGIEISTPLADQARQQTGCPVHTCFLADANLPKGSFDAVTMYDVIEHLQSPRTDLARACALLRPGGVLFLFTPNENALPRKIAKACYRLTAHAVSRPLKVLYYAQHLSYFTRASLSRLLLDSGFDIMGIHMQSYDRSRLRLSLLQQAALYMLQPVLLFCPPVRGKIALWARKR
ncbi:MAG: class I SAM-dependent methyltransferase [Deltaproteobacteria bacterium]|nr:class I SAM-dependent methyltransferase [Deltaproteobacteria bacterium]